MHFPTKSISKADPPAIDDPRHRCGTDTPAMNAGNSFKDGDVLFRVLFDHAGIGLAITDSEGCFKRVNPALCKMLGYAQKDLLGRRLQRIMAPNQWRRLSASVADILSGEQLQVQLSLECLHQDGQAIRTLLNLSQVADQAGGARYLIVQIHDINNLTRAERELEENRQCYQALSETTFEAVFIFREGICIDANQTASEMFDTSHEALIGIFGTDMFAPEYHSQVKKNLFSSNEEPYHAVAVKRDGTRFHVMIQGKMVRIGGSRVRVTMIRDIDAQVKVEAALRESERHLRSLMESASNFVLFRLRNNPENSCQPQPIFFSPSIAEIVDMNQVFDFQSWLKMIHPDDIERLLDAARKMFETKRLDQTVRILGPGDRGWRWLHIISVAVTDEVDGGLFFNGIILDITSEMEATAALKAREIELKERTESLSEVNTALEVLLRKREADRMDVEEKMLSNAKGLILPYLEKLKASRLDDRQRIYLNLVESNLNELISPLSQRMSRHYLNFTPLEIQVANLVKEGRTTKDIAQIMGLSIRTIEAVRYTIRRKLGLKKKRSNLRSYLLSIDGTDGISRRNG